MKKIKQQNIRVLAIVPSTKGFGFAVLDGQDMLVNWGGKRASGDKNTMSLAKVEKLIVQYRPDVIVVEDALAKDSRRAPRIRKLSKKITALAAKRKIMVKMFSREQVKQVFLADGKGTKHDIAEIIAARFPEELGFVLPPKRVLWKAEDSRMDFFNAVALALMPRLCKKK